MGMTSSTSAHDLCLQDGIQVSKSMPAHPPTLKMFDEKTVPFFRFIESPFGVC
jgi:hypothetical protein